VVVHVMSDYAFKKYLLSCSRSDLLLLRGMLLKVWALCTVRCVLCAVICVLCGVCCALCAV